MNKVSPRIILRIRLFIFKAKLETEEKESITIQIPETCDVALCAYFSYTRRVT